MAALAILIWVLATVVVGVPVGLLLRRLDTAEVEEVVDPAELHEAMGRHPSQPPKVA
jgi:hypothetical protein